MPLLMRRRRSLYLSAVKPVYHHVPTTCICLSHLFLSSAVIVTRLPSRVGTHTGVRASVHGGVLVLQTVVMCTYPQVGTPVVVFRPFISWVSHCSSAPGVRTGAWDSCSTTCGAATRAA